MNFLSLSTGLLALAFLPLKGFEADLYQRIAKLERKISHLNEKVNSLERELAQSRDKIDEPTPQLSLASTATRDSFKNYTIRSGDTLWHIAKRHQISLKKLTSSNPRLNPRRLKIGMSIRIPQQVEAPPQMAISNKNTPTSSVPKRSSWTPLLLEKPQKLTQLITVRKDQRLQEIAQNFRTSVYSLNRLNDINLQPHQMVRAGSELYVPAH